MSKMSKIDQIHLKAVMLFMSKALKMGKEHTHTFMLTTQILCIVKHVEDVKDRSNAPKGCNAMYVKDVEDGKRTHRHILLNTIFDVFDIHTLL